MKRERSPQLTSTLRPGVRPESTATFSLSSGSRVGQVKPDALAAVVARMGAVFKHAFWLSSSGDVILRGHGMRRRGKQDRWAVAVLIAGGAALHSTGASADVSPDHDAEPVLEPTPFTLSQPAVEAHVAYGAYTGDGFANPYGFGLGLRAGVTLPQSVYLGGVFEYYFGGSDERSNGFFDSIRSSANFVLLQAEPGYDFAFSEDLVLRPQLNLGFAYAQREDCIVDVCDKQSDANLAMAPAGTLLFRQDSYVLYFGVRYSAVATASDRSSGGGFLLTAGVGTPLERLGVRFLKNQP